MDAERLAALIEPVARMLLGEPNPAFSSKKELRFGSHGSLSVDLEKGTWYDHEQQVGGGTLDLIQRETGLQGGDRFDWLRTAGFQVDDGRAPRTNGNNSGAVHQAKPKLGKEVEHYDYLDEAGSMLFQVVRFEPKTFRQRRPDRNEPEGWSYVVRGVRQVPYRLPELIEAIGNERVIFVVEGERDVENWMKLNQPATTNAGGAGKWPVELNPYFHGADVVVIQDNDPQARKKDGALRFHPDGRPIFPGQDHARTVCEALSTVAARVRLLDLTLCWPELPKKGDSSDWIAHGGTIPGTFDVIEKLPDWSPDMPGPEPEKAPVEKLVFINMPALHGVPVPERKWVVENMIPAHNVTLLSGEGGIGKTLLAQQLAVGTVTGKDWIGKNLSDVYGPVIFLSAEDDTDEIHFRFDKIINHYNVGFCDLAHLHVKSLAGDDAVLATFDKNGIIQPTKLFLSLRESALDIRPRWIGIDTAADVFVVDERDRSQVRQCISLLRGLALLVDTAVILLAHPSLSGIASGSGLSGSTAWNNSVRSRLYLRSPKKKKKGDKNDNDQDEEPEDTSDKRLLEVMKANYGPAGETIDLKWVNGLLLNAAMADKRSPTERRVDDDEADAAFLRILLRFQEQGSEVSESPGKIYAPSVFAEQPDANAITSRAFTQAMKRLFVAKKIYNAQEGPPSKQRKRIRVVDKLL